MSESRREKALEEIGGLLRSGTIPTPVTYPVADELAERHGLTRRSVLAHVVRSGYPIKGPDDEASDDDDDDEVLTELPTTAASTGSGYIRPANTGHYKAWLT